MQHTSEKPNPGHIMDYDNIEVIDQVESDMKLRIKELLQILRRKPTLNKQLNAQSNFDIKTFFIREVLMNFLPVIKNVKSFR